MVAWQWLDTRYQYYDKQARRLHFGLSGIMALSRVSPASNHAQGLKNRLHCSGTLLDPSQKVNRSASGYSVPANAQNLCSFRLQTSFVLGQFKCSCTITTSWKIKTVPTRCELCLKWQLDISEMKWARKPWCIIRISYFQLRVSYRPWSFYSIFDDTWWFK